MRRLFFVVLAAIIAASIVPGVAGATAVQKWLNTDKLEQGAIGIEYEAPAGKKTKLIVAKGEAKYTYDLTADGQIEHFPLQLGDGSYKITIFEHVTGTKYKAVLAATVVLKLADDANVFLNSVQNVNWADASKATAKAQELVKGKKTDREKVQAIYNYVVNNTKYDYDLAKRVSHDYIPDIDDTLSSGKAICYGYASLFAAMLRSVDIPAKLAMGTTTYLDGMHAWNEVYIDGEWIILDTTVDYAYKAGKKSIEWAKDVTNYEVQRVY